MTDYLLRFPDVETAVSFGLASGFAHLDHEGSPIAPTATLDYALCQLGENDGDGFHWVMVRDLSGTPMPDGADDFICWHSDLVDDDGAPVSRPVDAPSARWA